MRINSPKDTSCAAGASEEAPVFMQCSRLVITEDCGSLLPPLPEEKPPRTGRISGSLGPCGKDAGGKMVVTPGQRWPSRRYFLFDFFLK
jgi:hypothetical protein